MKRTFIKIILIFFLFALLLPSRLSADVSIAPGLMLREEISGFDLQYLQSIVRQLDRYGRMSGLRRVDNSFTIIHNKGNVFGFHGRYLYLPGTALQWQEDLPLRRKVYAALAACLYGFRLPADSEGVAEWIVCGIDAELDAAAESGQFLSANRGFPLLMEFAGYCGALPDYAAMCRIGYTPVTVLREFFAEQSRMLLLILADNGKIKDLFARSAAGARPECFLDYYASERKAKEILDRETEARLWSRYHPMPPELAIIRLMEIDIIFVQKADAKGNVTGEYVECDWRKMAQMLRIPRQDAPQLRKELAGKYNALAKLLPANERQYCRNIASAAMLLGVDDEAEARFSRNLELLKTALLRRKQIDRFLQDTLVRTTPVPDNFARLFSAAKFPNLAALPEEMRFLRNVLNSYLR